MLLLPKKIEYGHGRDQKEVEHPEYADDDEAGLVRLLPHLPNVNRRKELYGAPWVVGRVRLPITEHRLRENKAAQRALEMRQDPLTYAINRTLATLHGNARSSLEARRGVAKGELHHDILGHVLPQFAAALRRAHVEDVASCVVHHVPEGVP